MLGNLLVDKLVGSLVVDNMKIGHDVTSVVIGGFIRKEINRYLTMPKSKLPPSSIPCRNDGTEVCNLGYACDGCPFNAENMKDLDKFVSFKLFEEKNGVRRFRARFEITANGRVTGAQAEDSLLMELVEKESRWRVRDFLEVLMINYFITRIGTPEGTVYLSVHAPKDKAVIILHPAKFAKLLKEVSR